MHGLVASVSRGMTVIFLVSGALACGGRFARRGPADVIHGPSRPATPVKRPSSIKPAPDPPASGPLWHTLRPGPYVVGYRVLYELDHSRAWPAGVEANFTSDVARPIRVSVWYPARPRGGGGPFMSTGDYLERRAPDSASAHLERVIVERRLEFIRRVFADAYTRRPDTLAAVLARRTAAVRDAEPAADRFPVVLYAAGWDNVPPDNSVLCEYLASHGYVVATVPQLIPSVDAPIRPQTAAQVEDDARDLEVAYGALARLGTVADRRRIGVMGFSGGGAVALSVAMRNPHVRAVVGLDPIFGFAEGAGLILRLPHFGATAVTAPMLVLQAGDSAERIALANDILDSLRFADRYQGRVGRTTHMEFADGALTIGASWPGDAARAPAARDAYAAIARTVRAFLDGTLKGNGAALDSVARGATGSRGAGLVTMRLRRAAGTLALTVRDLARYEGTYQLTRTNGERLPVRIYEVGGELALRVADERPIPLGYRGGDTFDILATPPVRLVFTVEQGRATKIVVYQRGRVYEVPRAR